MKLKYRIILPVICLIIFWCFGVQAEEDKTVDPKRPPDAKALSGMSIVGNDEAPKSLYIVPWKSSEIGQETSLDTLLNESAEPVDRDVFMRQVEFFRIRTER